MFILANTALQMLLTVSCGKYKIEQYVLGNDASWDKINKMKNLGASYIKCKLSLYFEK